MTLSDTIVKHLPTPATGNKVHWDSSVIGFGVRVTKNGARSFVLDYRTRAGRQRTTTIGRFGDWKTAAAREHARELKRRVGIGEDPLEETQTQRDAKTVADMIDRFEEEHLPKTRASTARCYRGLIVNNIRPQFGTMKVCDVTPSDIDDLHRKMRGSPYQANRTVAVLSKMFSLAVRWGWRTDNPAKGVERNQEVKRARYLEGDELGRLIAALAGHQDRQAANAVRLLLLTGCRRGEALGARWDEFDLEAGVWIKPGHRTKQRTQHRAPISAPARLLLSNLRAEAEREAKRAKAEVSPFVFPSHGVTGHRIELKKDWAALCAVAKIKGLRAHDLRHSYASALVNLGTPLSLIGGLLGHSSPMTTSRYSHLYDDSLRAATEKVGKMIKSAHKPSGKIVPFRKARKTGA